MIIRFVISKDAYLQSLLLHVRTQDRALGEATARALSRFRAPAARIGLLHLLHHPDRAVVIAAVEGLGAIGTIEEVEHLLAIGGGWFGDRTLRRAARRAIDAIQSRSTGKAGSLSLATLEGERGALSAA